MNLPISNAHELPCDSTTKTNTSTTQKSPDVADQDLVSKDLNQLANPLGDKQAEIVASLLDRHVPFYVRLQVSPFEAQAAKLLNELLRTNKPNWPLFHLFFCSSRLEAISGAIKIVRHNRLIHMPTGPVATAVYDPSNHLVELYDPLRKGIEHALIPGLMYFDNLTDTLAAITTFKVSSVLITNLSRIPVDELQDLLSAARTNNIYSILDESSANISRDGFACRSIAAPPDVIVLGENLTDHRAPSGGFMMSSKLYKVWNTFGNYNLHSNTWGGNSLSMSLTIEHLKSSNAFLNLSPSIQAEIEAILNSHKLASKEFAKYNNPKMTTMMQLSNLNKDISYASQSKLKIGKKSQSADVIDAAGTYGVNLRGHCPADYKASVLYAHDPQRDYWADLEKAFQNKTGLPHLLPAVSGTSANDIALTMALLANYPRRRIVALEMGYHGKTLLSLAATYKQRIRAPFGPLYPFVTFVDPLSPDVEQQLTKLFESGDVALVSLETIQGEGGVRSCPQRLLDFLAAQRDRYGYMISVDEVQTGMYRTGRFLNHQNKLHNPDLIVVGKGMSDMVFPVAATNVSAHVFHSALSKNKLTVQHFTNQYRCQLGAHTALHAIESADRLGLAERAKETGDYFKQRLQEIANATGMVREIRGEGLMIGFELDPSSVPKLFRGSYGGLVASRFANDSKTPVLVAFNPDKPHLIRFLPPLTITRQEIDAVLATTQRCLSQRLWKLVFPLVTNVVKPKVWLPHMG